MTQGSPISSRIAARLGHGVDDAALGHVEPDLEHRVLEELPILRLADDLGRRREQLDAVACASTPDASSAIATLSPVCPPIVGSSASGRSRAITFSTTSAVTGSM